MSEYHSQTPRLRWLTSAVEEIAKMTCMLNHQGNHHYQHNQCATTGGSHIKMIETYAINKWFVVWIEYQQDAGSNGAKNVHSTMCVGVTQKPPKRTEAMAGKIVTRFLGFQDGKDIDRVLILGRKLSIETNVGSDCETRVYIMCLVPRYF